MTNSIARYRYTLLQRYVYILANHTTKSKPCWVIYVYCICKKRDIRYRVINLVLTYIIVQTIETVLVAITGMLALLSLILWLERMVRIVMANYLISSILLGMSNFIELAHNRLVYGEATTWWIARVENILWNLLMTWKPTILLTIYFLLLLFIVKKAHIGIGTVRNEWLRIILTLLFIPCTVISILLSLATAIFGAQLMDASALQWFADLVSHNPFLYNFILLTPLRVVLPGLMTIAIAAFVLRTKDEIIQRVVVHDPEFD